ncbi:MAG: ABC transporter ATP-binding protein [Spirochaetia bacterium]|nr:ABC transporter ATP-binding protein [Spirochaetia bacterium]
MEVISVTGLSKSFKTVKAVDSLDISVQQGEIYGLIGPDGGGKTTTLRLLCGLLLPESGEITVLDRRLPEAAEGVKEHIGYMCQRFSLYTDLTVEENITFFADIYGIKKQELKERLKPLLEMTRLEPFKDRLAGKLSGGMKQKLALICTLIHRPQILFLDEPTTGVDPVSRREFWEILQSIHTEGVTIVVTTPYMDEAEQCSRIGLMFKGKIIATDTPKNLKKNLNGIVLEAHPAFAADFREMIKACTYITDWQQMGERFRVVVKDEASAADITAAAGETANIRRIAASVEDVFVQKIKT